MNTQLSPAAAQALADFADIFDLQEMPNMGGNPALAELEQAMQESGLGATTASLSSIGSQEGGAAALSEVDLLFLDGFIKGKVKSLIKKLYEYVHRYSHLIECVPLVTETVKLFNQRKYFQALKKGWDALQCILSKL